MGELNSKELKEQNALLREQIELKSKNSDLDKKAKKISEDFTDAMANGIKEADAAIDDLGDSLKNLSWEDGLPADQAAEFTNEISGLYKELKKCRDVEGPMDEAKLKDQQARLEEIKKDIIGTRKNMVKVMPAAKANAASFRLMGESASEFGNMWKSVGAKSPRQLKASAMAAGQTANQMKEWGSLVAGAGKGFAGLGTMVGGLGKVLGGLSKFMAGPFGLAAIGVKALWDMGMAADKFVKDANKAFAMVRGPDIMTGNVKKQFKDFNNAVYSIGDNIRTGLNAAQVREFFQAVTQAGTTLEKVTAGYGDYRDAVNMAARASKVMGVELPQVGAMMSDLVNNFRMRMKDVDSLFVQTAFSAQKAGVSTDKFWAAIANANASLAFYNVSLSSTAKQLQKFTQSGVMGFEDASKLTTDLAQSFKNMSTEQRAAFTALVGKDAMAGALTDAAKRAEGQYKKIGKDLESRKLQLSVTTDPGEKETIAAEISRLTKNYNGAFAKWQAIDQGSKADNAVAMAESIVYAGADSGALIADMLKRQLMPKGGSMKDVEGENLITFKKVLEATGINADILLQMKDLSQQSYNQLTTMLGVNEQGVKANNSVMNSLDALKDKGALLNNLVTDDAEAKEKASQSLIAALQQDGAMTATEATDLVNAIGVDAEVTKAVQAAVDANTKGTDPKIIAQNLKEAFDKSGAADKAAFQVAGDTLAGQSEQAKKADKTFKEIVNQTLSFQEMQDITKDGLQWQAYQFGFLQSLNKGVFSIYKLMLGKNKTPEAKDREKRLIAAGMTKQTFGGLASRTVVDEERVKQAVKDKTTNLASQQKAADSLQDSVDKQEKALQDMLDKGEDPVTLKNQQDLIKRTKESLKIAQDNVAKTQKEIDLLVTGNETSEKSAKLLKMLAMGNKKAAGEDIASMMAEGMSIEDISSDMGISVTDAIQSLMAAGKWDAGKSGLNQQSYAKEIAEADKRNKAENPTVPATPVAPAPAKAGLIGSYQVKKQSENLLLHRGESVTGAQQGGGKSINITVNATETDMAKKIANEIQAALYQAKMA